MTDWKNWVLDVSFDPPIFCPYDDETGDIVTGLNLMTTTCPGKLVAIVHAEGDAALEAWIEQHPSWQQEYGKDIRKEIKNE